MSANLPLIERMVTLGAHLTRLRPGMKQPTGRGWQIAAAITPAEADAYVSSGGNIGVNLGLSGMIAFDAEDLQATVALVEAGFKLTVAPAKHGYNGVLKPGLDDPASGKENAKVGGSHVWLRVPDTIDASQLSSDHSMQLTLPNGGLIDVLAGKKYAVAPPSALELTYGSQYQPFGGGPLDLSLGDEAPDVAEAPAWLFDLSVPCPPELAPLHGCLIPRVREHAEQSARSADLSAQIDEVPWDQWLAGEPRLTPTGEIDGCGCDIYYWQGSTNSKSATLHDGCEQGNGVHVWSGTMIAQLGLTGHHVSRLDLATALRGEPRSVVAASVGIQLGGERAELGTVRPADYLRCADHFEREGLAEKAEIYRRAAAVMATYMPTPEARGETFISEPMVGMEAAVPQPDAGDGAETADAPIAPVIPMWTGTVPPAFGGPAAEVAYSKAPNPGPFPIDALPPVLKAHAEWVMEAINVPGSMVGPMYLPVLSAACNRATISPRIGWIESGCPLWAIIIAPPSSRKSPALAKVDAPLKTAQRLLRERTDKARRRGMFEAEALEEAAEEAKKKYVAAVKAARNAVSTPVASAGAVADAQAAGIPSVIVNMKAFAAADADVEALRVAYEQLEQEAQEARACVPGRAVLSFEDATDAAMQDLMSACDGYGFLVATEASSWFNAMIREDSAHVTPGYYLKGYSNEAFKVFRKGRGEVWVDDPFLPMLHIIQPDPLEAALKPDRDGHNRLIGNGTWARFGVSFVDDADPDTYDRPIPDGTAVESAYSDLVEREFLRSYGRKQPLRFGLAVEAQPLMGAIYDRVERVIESQRRLPGGVGMAEEWGKACGRMLRIARVFRQIELTDAELNSDRIHQIGIANLREAWRITEWMMSSQAYAMGGAKADSDEELVAKAVTWLRKRLAKDGAVEYRTLRDNRTHRPYLDGALDQMTAAGEITLDDSTRSNATVTPTENLAAAA
ncbi:DUF3987 domain-containing protein [Mycobacteroides chelonae]|uniref:DUF3987 domain-containing protein n=1 Tax=Mycobacteroides chelonae TaxID=1774 RepID=UPI0018B08A2A|nr:DUF3987 domain-containing protein [Mycobacteroides chelonae]MBF9519519.1 DUF3987 domain-containing protein [Mycobacteroides chelonae]